MSQVEELVRGALSSAPTPATTTLDPLADLERRLGRARLRLGGVAIAVVVVLVAAIVVPLSVIGGGSSSGPAQITSTAWAPGADITALSSGGGYVWTVSDSSAHRDHEMIQKRDASNGRIVATYQVDNGSQFAAFGAGGLWVWGRGGGSHPRTDVQQLVAYDSSFDNVDLAGFGDGILVTPRRIGMTFVGAYGYAIKARGQLIAAFQTGDPTTALPGGLKVPGVLSVLAVQGKILALGKDRVLGQYGTDGWPPAVQTRAELKNVAKFASEPVEVKGLPLVASAAGVWAQEGGQLIQEGLDGRQIGAAISAPPENSPGPRAAFLVAQPDLVVDKSGGLYVALPSPATFGDHPVNLLYYSAAALAASDPQPTAVRVSSDRIDSITADPKGGIVFTGATLGRWNPTNS